MTAAPRPLALAAGGLVALAAAMGIGRFVYTPILPIMTEALGMTQAAAGFIASANFLGYLAGAFAAATSLLRGSRRAWFMGGLAASAVTTGAMGLVDSEWAFLALRFAGGVASAFVLVFSSALVIDRLHAAGRSALAALHFAGVGVGIAVAALLVSSLAALGFGWRAQWLASGIVSLVALAVVAVLIPDRPEPQASSKPQAAEARRGLTALITAYGLFGFGYVITATFLVAIVRGSDAIRPLEPVIWLVVGVAAAPSIALWTWVARSIDIARAFALACILEAMGVGASVLWISTPGVLLAAVLLGGTFVGITALGLVGARQLSRGDPRHTLALMTAAFGLGQTIGPAFAGVLSDTTGSFLAPSLVAAGALLVSALLVGAGRTHSSLTWHHSDRR
ncbi:MAG: YbfB/YjiJ family MFS transporter [Betaproteobacteria bacterium]|nr:YbfB/YjiJ family MFS transporter [Betaproteobacteria bacterium]